MFSCIYLSMYLSIYLYIHTRTPTHPPTHPHPHTLRPCVRAFVEVQEEHCALDRQSDGGPSGISGARSWQAAPPSCLQGCTNRRGRSEVKCVCEREGERESERQRQRQRETEIVCGVCVCVCVWIRALLHSCYVCSIFTRPHKRTPTHPLSHTHTHLKTCVRSCKLALRQSHVYTRIPLQLLHSEAALSFASILMLCHGSFVPFFFFFFFSLSVWQCWMCSSRSPRISSR
jgi:hypothetical protein